MFRNAASLANIKANRARAVAVVEDIRIEDCTYTNSSFEDKPYNRAPITIENPRGRFACLAGLAELPVRNVTFEEVTGSAKSGLHGQNLDGIALRNVSIAPQAGEAFVWINVKTRPW